jgi:serine/threonine-protein kinase
MTPCPSRADLLDLLADRLPAEQERPMLAHVETCPACQEVLEELTAACAPGPGAGGGVPPREPYLQTDSFWRGLKAAVPVLGSTLRPGPADGLPDRGKDKAADATLPGRLGRYELLEEIGRGGMGAVLRGHDPELGRDLAVKVLLPDHQHDLSVVRRFTGEARIGGQLQHPGIVPVYEMGRSADQLPYFTMKLVRGRTLAELIRERADPRQDLPRFLQVFEQVCQTMAYAHSRGVIHRDLKPSNVMVGAFGEVQVMDWGLAKVLDRGGEKSSVPGWCVQATRGLARVLDREGGASPRPEPQSPGKAAEMAQTLRGTGTGPASKPGQVLGTPAYMAPEQAAGAAARLDERCDVFGLGAILCEILTGQPPYGGARDAHTLDKALRADLDDAFARLGACGADPDLIRLARSSLAVEAADRPRDGGVLAAELAAHRESMEARLRQAELAQAEARARAEEERKRRRVKVALAAALLALLLLATGSALWFERQREERRAEAAQRQGVARQAIEAALERADPRRAQGRWREAKAVLAQAESRLDEADSQELRQRLKQARADLDLVTRLDRIRMDRAAFAAGAFAADTAERDYPAAFAAAGLAVTSKGTAERIRRSAIREQLVAALDDWALATSNEVLRWRLIRLASSADPDPQWRDRLPGPLVWNKRAERAALEGLADEVPVAKLSPQFLTMLGVRLRRAGADPERFLRTAQGLHPADFWLNYDLGLALLRSARPAEAAGFFRAALVARPDCSHVYSKLGYALIKLGQPEEAVAACRRAVEFDPLYADAYFNLAEALSDQGQPEEAVAEYRYAIQLDPQGATAHQLGMCLQSMGQWDEAMAAYRRSIALNPKGASAHYQLGVVLRERRRFEEAIGEFRQAVQFDPGGAQGHEDLAEALLRRGRFDEARTAAQRGLDLLPGHEPRRRTLQNIQKQCGRMIALDAQLPALLQGQGRPADAAKLRERARWCRDYGRPYAAACLYAAAFAALPALAEDLGSRNRSDAARAAADPGPEGAPLGEPERAGLRRQALGWLRADLALRTKGLQAGKSEGRTLATWQTDDALAGVRERAALEKLPDDERAAWQRLWADVAAALAADPLEQGWSHAARREWGKAADCYARALKRAPRDHSHFWFEYAAVLLLSGDREGYARACAHMLARCQPKGPMRPYLVARACTLAPDAVAAAAKPGLLAGKELTTEAGEFWSLTEQGALRYRAGQFQAAGPLLEKSLRAEHQSGRAVLNWLWLALAKQRLGKTEEARRWLGKAQAWLDQYAGGMPARADEELGLHLHNWLEAHILRREAEALLSPR